MGKKLLIDATHAEETRVVVVDGNKVDEFDFETIHKRQLAGNIYLAKVTRVEPSLQAAFVDYGGNRHGFLAFAEIHPDYYQIPVADRQALLAEERALAEAEEEAPKKSRNRRRKSSDDKTAEKTDADTQADDATATDVDTAAQDGQGDVTTTAPKVTGAAEPGEAPEGETPSDADPVAPQRDDADGADTDATQDATQSAPEENAEPAADETPSNDDTTPPPAQAAEIEGEDARTYGSMDVVDLDDAKDDDAKDDDAEDEPFRAADVASEIDETIESVADDDVTDEVRPARRSRARRYKIQEVIKVRQIMLVQVVKEERGNKGAALTTYLSLAGRYCVLMPNTARGGGISRKITNAADRKKLKEIASGFELPEGAGLIVRTAGANRTKAEIKRDYEYLSRVWSQIRELTLKSIAPAPIYEEGDLIKRSIRDLYNKDIDEVLVEGEAGYRTAKDFMKMIMPSHAKNVKPYVDQMPLFARYQVESYLGAMFNPTVQLKSGGYIVIGVTEALVAIDINSGKSTREGSIEDTALKTNLEAAEEIARQLRLRDLAGLIVIDFIDMEERRNNNAVEKKLKDSLRNDRARIQVGRISGFGLLEMSRQRLRPGMLEATTQPCAHCHGTGLIRSDNSLALQILRALEEEGTRNRSKEVLVKAPVGIVNYLFNHKREHMAQIEARYGMAIRLEADVTLISPDYSIEKFKTATRVVQALPSPVVSFDAQTMSDLDDEIEADEVDDNDAEDTVDSRDETREDGDGGKRKRRRRRRRRGKGGDDASEGRGDSADDKAADSGADDAGSEDADAGNADSAQTAEGDSAATSADEAEAKPARTRRSRSRRKKADQPSEEAATDAAEADASATEVAEDAPADAPAEKPKRKRAPRRKKTVDAEQTATTEPDAASAVSDAEAPAEPVAEAQPAKATPTEAPEAPGEPPAEAAVPPAADAPTPVEDAPAEHPAAAAVAEAAEDAPMDAPMDAPVASGAEGAGPEPDVQQTQPDQPEAPAKPKRRGWWNRG